MASPDTQSLSLPEPLEPVNQPGKKDHYSDLMPVEIGGLELSEPTKGTPDQVQQFQTVTSGATDHSGHIHYSHGQSSTNPCLDSSCSTRLQSRERDEGLVFGIRRAFFWLGLLCLILLNGTIAASAIAGSKAKYVGVVEERYKV